MSNKSGPMHQRSIPYLLSVTPKAVMVTIRKVFLGLFFFFWEANVRFMRYLWREISFMLKYWLKVWEHSVVQQRALPWPPALCCLLRLVGHSLFAQGGDRKMHFAMFSSPWLQASWLPTYMPADLLSHDLFSSLIWRKHFPCRET